MIFVKWCIDGEEDSTCTTFELYDSLITAIANLHGELITVKVISI